VTSQEFKRWLAKQGCTFEPGRGGHLNVSIEHIPVGVHFLVTDNGSGIPEHMLESIFERFWQVGKNDRRGAGLGLYIAESIVTGHGGTIWAESTIGSGSTFHFTLPLEQPEVVLPPPPSVH